MFDIGFWELALIGLLALVVLGPKRLPEAAATAGRWVGKLRRFVANVKRDLDGEFQSGDLAEFRRLKAELGQTKRMLEESSSALVKGFTDGARHIADDGGLDAGLEVKKKRPAVVKKTKKKTKALKNAAPRIGTKPTRKKKTGKKSPPPKKKKAVKKPVKKTKKAKRKIKKKAQVS
jgi:sec-independent protein translocase protein TatB